MVVIDLIGFGIVMPVLPVYSREFGANGLVLGLLLTSYSAAQFVCAPLWGRLSDRLGRRPVMLGTVAGTAGSLLLLGLAPSLAWLFVARVLGGAFGANLGLASAYIADATGEEERTRWMGLLGASFGVGFVLGPLLVAALGPLGSRVPMFAAAGLAAANLVHAAVSLREAPRAPGEGTGAARLTRLTVLREPAVRRLCLANLTFSVGVTQLETVFVFFMLDRFGYGLFEIGLLMAGMAVLTGGVQGGAMRRLAARFQERSLVRGGALLLAAALASMPGLGELPALLAVLALAAVGRAVIQPSLLSLVSRAAAPGERGIVMGTFQSFASAARVVGPVAAGALYDRSEGAPFLLAAALLAALALWTAALPVREGPAPSRPPGV